MVKNINKKDKLSFNELFRCVEQEIAEQEARERKEKVARIIKPVLLNACKDDKVDVVREFLGFGEIFFKITDYKRRSALHIAARHGSAEVVKEILSSVKAPDLRSFDKNEYTPLMLACKYGHYATVVFFLEKIASYARSENYLVYKGAECLYVGQFDNSTPLEIAYGKMKSQTIGSKKLDYEKIVKALSEQIFFDACKNCCEEKMRYYSQYDLNLGELRRDGNTLLHAVMHAYSDSRDILKLLLKDKTIVEAINVKDVNGQTALHMACKNGDYEAIDLLISDGADPRVIDNKGSSPIQLLPKLSDEATAEARKINKMLSQDVSNPLLPLFETLSEGKQRSSSFSIDRRCPNASGVLPRSRSNSLTG